MKTRSAITLLLAFFLCAMSAVADLDARLIGTWAQEGAEATWTFRPDGSGFMEQANPRSTARFTWSCRGVQLQVSTGSLRVPYTLMSIDGGAMTIRNDQAGSTYRLRKKG